MGVLNHNWKIIGKSVRGASHIRMEMPNQDAIKWRTVSQSDELHVMSLADGHGSRVCFRSNVGAKLAVEIMNRLLEQGYSLIDKGVEVQEFGSNISSEFMRLWQMYVKKHLKENPFIDDEVSDLNAVKRKILGKNAYIAYGSTLITVMAYGNQVYCWQLGDGDILEVDSKREVLFPIPKDKRFIGNETTSTCSPNAHTEFKFHTYCIPDTEKCHMLLLATDGYSNSFKTQLGFKKAGIDFFDMINEDGLEEVDNNLLNWLEETSNLGSGDDISLGIMLYKLKD